MSASKKAVEANVEIPASLWKEACERVIHADDAEQDVGEFLQERIEFTYRVSGE